MSSETRTFTGFSGTYTLNYSYNLADMLTTLSIPFRSQQIGYNYDSAGRLSGVTASGFSATYIVGSNQYTQTITSFGSNITYRAWGARKSMTYGNTTSEQVTYNARLLPVTYTLNNMNYQNVTVCCPNPTYSTMTWSYDYFDDGRIKTAWDSSNNWFDRAYTYDHAGRLKEALTYRRARGLSPYPSNLYPDPYHQNITYDAFNHTSRTGLLYTGEPSDVGTWINNRRTDSGWQYDANGNTTVDPNFTHTFDAAGKTSHSVSFDKVGDGVNYPFQPRTDIEQTYDGIGAPGKRIQISRQPDSFDSGAPPIEDVQTTYYLRSTVLDGAAVVELNGPGGSDIVNVYAAGQRIARDEWNNVRFEQINPVTGSLVVSHGHPANRSTTRQERDSFGAEIPNSNPYPSSQHYVDLKFGEQMYIEGGDPFDYSTGREIDGIPVSESEFQRRVGNDSAVGDVFRGGRYVGSINLSKNIFFSRIRIVYDVYRPPLELLNNPMHWDDYYDHSYEEEVELQDRLSTYVKSERWLQPPDVKAIRNNLEKMLGNGGCGKFISELLDRLGATKGNPTLQGSILDLYDMVNQQKGLVRGGLATKYKVTATLNGRLIRSGKAGDASIHLGSSFTFMTTTPEEKAASVARLDAFSVLHELVHLAASNDPYTDRQVGIALSQMGYDGLPIRQKGETDRQFIGRNSTFFSDVLRQKCPPL
jgi:hypothetical protein